MKRFLIALQFLTVLPVKIKSEIAEEDFGKSLLYFPVVGMLIGFVPAGMVLLLGFLPIAVVGVLILIISIVMTGGIHLDGFADTCDGFYGQCPKEKILEIMRDSRVGVMGAVGMFCLLALKLTLIISLPPDVLWKLLIMMTVFARWSQVFACCTSGYAREEGKAGYFVKYADKTELLVGSVFTVISFLLLMRFKGIVLLVLSFAVVLLFISYAKKKIGGMTGDTIGATSEIAEIAVLLFGLIYSEVQAAWF
ncbi:MAG: adenosylcobinamide-GDP ribazoletransferase [Planctomycetes bacterium]|nr:adenosylcobinamide-GDP ribazoletransferase [Planctomycetota bacterium]